MVVTDNDAVAERVQHLRNHGIVTANGYTRFECAGFNYRMTDLQGALGVVQMGRLEEIIARRIALAGLYHQTLARIPSIVRPVEMAGGRHIWQSYVILIKEGLERDTVVKRLREQEIEATIGTYAVSVQPHYARVARDYPTSRQAFE